MKRIYLLFSISLPFAISGQTQYYLPAFQYEPDSNNIPNVISSNIKNTSTFESGLMIYKNFANISTELHTGNSTAISAKRPSGKIQDDVMLRTITIPADADSGITEIRALKDTNVENSPSLISPARLNLRSGQSEDYSVTMVNKNTDFPAPYCSVSAITSLTVSEISNVEFAGSSRNSNLDGSSPVIENFTDIIFDVNRGNSYPISITGGTHGQATVSMYVYIDLNQNNVFDDNEKFNLGYLDNSDPVPGKQSGKVSGLITIPNDALTGETRFRLVKAYESSSWMGTLENSPCPSGWFIGQVEDYTINIQPSSLSVNEIKKETAKIYPNPTTGLVKIKTEDRIEKFEIYNLAGQKVMEGNSSTIDVAHFQPGVYMTKIYMQNQKIIIKKIIKK